ncbi:Mut7-C RNAse domain-containing protein [Halobium salinum]|uniref:Mut7-C RNAse domain-containing protein n=1 Tax=Halobium salinum TaxID=1364940 RepID=A0ABD5P7Y9_9EURY|nr:Mut7-C RNAse domain-containing protein [Halobium salinum]
MSGVEGAESDCEDRPRLLLDVMLGKLATYLRMCGYDTAYALDRDVEADDRLLRMAAEEGRTLLTRNVRLAERAGRDEGVPGALLLETREVVDQLAELRAAGFVLALANPPRRCSVCNGRVEAVAEGESRPDYAPNDGSAWRCRNCGQLFWKGSHWDDVAATLASVSVSEEES